MFFDFAPDFTDLERFILCLLLKFIILLFDIPRPTADVMANCIYTLVKYLEILSFSLVGEDCLKPRNH